MMIRPYIDLCSPEKLDTKRIYSRKVYMRLYLEQVGVTTWNSVTTWKVVKGHYITENTAPPLPLDEILTLVSGKYPLHDYKDLNIHTYIFDRQDPTLPQVSGILVGFTYDCVQDVQPLGYPGITIELPDPVTTPELRSKNAEPESDL